jgi:hypothetical protein
MCPPLPTVYDPSCPLRKCFKKKCFQRVRCSRRRPANYAPYTVSSSPCSSSVPGSSCLRRTFRPQPCLFAVHSVYGPCTVWAMIRWYAMRENIRPLGRTACSATPLLFHHLESTSPKIFFPSRRWRHTVVLSGKEVRNCDRDRDRPAIVLPSCEWTMSV